MRRNDETWSERLVQRLTHIWPICNILMKSIAINWRLHCASNIFKHLSCKPGRFIQRSGNLRMIRAICHGKMTGPFEASFSWRPAWPFWSLSLHYNVCSAFQQLTETDLLGSCCHVMLPLATATFVPAYGALCVLVQARPTPMRLGRFRFRFTSTSDRKAFEHLNHGAPVY